MSDKPTAERPHDSATGAEAPETFKNTSAPNVETQESYKLPPRYYENEEKLPYHDDPEDDYVYEDNDVPRREISSRSASLCRIIFFLGFFGVWGILYAYFLHVPTLARCLFGCRQHNRVEIPGAQNVQTAQLLVENLKPSVHDVPQTQQVQFGLPVNLGPMMGSQNEEIIELEVEETVIVDEEHGVVIEEISIHPPKQKSQGKPGLPPFIEARQRNPFAGMFGAPGSVAIVVEVEDDGSQKVAAKGLPAGGPQGILKG